jgi:FtsZ-binding cell division protein ZapB
MTTELDRLKVLEAKIGRVVEFVNKLGAENEKLKAQVKDLRSEKKDLDDLAKRAARLDEDMKRYENERETLKGRIDAIIAQIDKLGL